MALASGSRVGPYEIVSPAGAGGMGEVYRALDGRLHREIAIKILPPAFSADADRLRRFQQEAQAAAALNHPNILAVYDFGQHDGSPYIATELLEGETLRDRLRSGALPIRKATDYGLQITRGLAAAHEKGIVHRDLKPENIFVTRDGRVKILDFGLAKLTRLEESQSGDAPTMTARTDPGVVMGTVGYMSPEQVRGQAADHRSDIFSFGAILHEMLSGKRAFHGGTAVETMSAILKQDPLELSKTNRNIPPALERIVRHCLEKNPAERFQSAGDIAFDLESLASLSSASPVIRPMQRSRLSRMLIPVLAAILLVIAAFLLGRRTAVVTQPSFHRLTFQRGMLHGAFFSPDGHTVVYSASWNGNPRELYSTRAEFPESRQLGISQHSVFGISPTNELALGGTEGFETTLSKAPLAGGTPRAVLEHIHFATWGPDGQVTIVRVAGGRVHLEYPPGKFLYETAGYISHPRVSPKGDRIAFLDHPFWPDSRGSVALVDLNGHKQTLTQEYEDEEGVAWSPSGDEIWYTASPTGSHRSLYAVTTSGHQRLVFSVPGSVLLHDVAADGRVLLSSDETRIGVLGRRPGEAAERDLSWFEATLLNDISPDGQWLLVDEQGELGGANYSAGMRKLDGSPAVLLGEGDARSFSPDGKWVAAIRRGAHQQLLLLPTGAGEVRTVPTPGIEHYGFSVGLSPNGKLIFFSGSEPGHGMRTYVQELDGGKPRAIAPEGVEASAISPDGKYLVGSTGSGALSLYPLDGSTPRPLQGPPQGCDPIRWSADGGSLFIICSGVPAKIHKMIISSGKSELVRELMPADSAGVNAVFTAVMTPDAKTYAYGYIRRLETLYVVEGLK